MDLGNRLVDLTRGYIVGSRATKKNTHIYADVRFLMVWLRLFWNLLIIGYQLPIRQVTTVWARRHFATEFMTKIQDAIHAAQLQHVKKSLMPISYRNITYLHMPVVTNRYLQSSNIADGVVPADHHINASVKVVAGPVRRGSAASYYKGIMIQMQYVLTYAWNNAHITTSYLHQQILLLSAVPICRVLICFQLPICF